LTILVAQPVCHSAFDGDVRLGKYYARIIRDGIFLRILAGIDKSQTEAGLPRVLVGFPHDAALRHLWITGQRETRRVLGSVILGHTGRRCAERAEVRRGNWQRYHRQRTGLVFTIERRGLGSIEPARHSVLGIVKPEPQMERVGRWKTHWIRCRVRGGNLSGN
jgi:hypothetical protein